MTREEGSFSLENKSNFIEISECPINSRYIFLAFRRSWK